MGKCRASPVKPPCLTDTSASIRYSAVVQEDSCAAGKSGIQPACLNRVRSVPRLWAFGAQSDARLPQSVFPAYTGKTMQMDFTVPAAKLLQRFFDSLERGIGTADPPFFRAPAGNWRALSLTFLSTACKIILRHFAFSEKAGSLPRKAAGPCGNTRTASFRRARIG